MSCRQGSLPEAPNGQKYIPWCLHAFVLEKPLQALWVPFWRQLPRQVREGREGNREKKGGFSSSLATGKPSVERRADEHGEGGVPDSVFCLQFWELGLSPVGKLMTPNIAGKF